VTTGTGRQLRCPARQLGRTAHLLLLGRHRLRARYGRGSGRSGPVLLLGRLTHALLLTLCGGARGGSELGPQVLVLAQQPGQFSLDLVEEGVDLVLVIAFSETDGRELLVPHVLRGQRHLFFTSTLSSAIGKTVSFTAGSRP
jgi:hypothetical protein